MDKIVISNIEELIKNINELPNSCIFRGHANSNYELQSPLERACGNKFSRKFASQCEEYSFDQFSARFHLYDKENIQPKSRLEWLSIMQHYGVPTRLLDFTTSPYAALYFGLETYDIINRPNISLYSIDYSQLMDVSLSLISDADNNFNETRKSIIGKQDDIFKETLDRFNRDILWVTEPQRLNARIDRQAGCFLVSGDKGARIEELINSPKYSSVDIVKYEIEEKLIEGIFTLLRKMNISGKSIYGDLTGLAKSISLEFKVYSA